MRRTLYGGSGGGRLLSASAIAFIACIVAFATATTIVEPTSTTSTTTTVPPSQQDDLETFDEPPGLQPTIAAGSSAPAPFPFACPEKCTCKALQPSDSTGGGLKVKCGSAHRVTSLKDIDFGAMRPEIQHLDLSRNQINAVEAADFHNFTALRKLDLSGNVLVSIERDAFGAMASLERLKLANNAIVHVFQGAFDGMAQLKMM